MHENNIKLTEAAIAHAKKIIARQNKGQFLRISVRKRGCTGYTYVLDIVAEPQTAMDLKYEQDGLSMLVDAEALPFIKGMQIDFINKGMGREEWQFNNPNVESACGCGESFNIKEHQEAQHE